MARYKEGQREDLLLLSGSLDHMLPAHSVARTLWAGLEQLDFSGFDQAYKNDAAGRAAIDPRALVAVIMLGLLRGITSSVKVAALCEQDIEFRWLVGNVRVEKSTLCEFRKKNVDKLTALSAQVLSALSQSGLLPGENMGIDGSIVRAAASPHARRSRKHLQKERERLEQFLRTKLEAADSEACSEETKLLEKRRQRMDRALEEMKARGLEKEKDKLTVSEPDARNLRQKDGSFAPGYNAQVTADLDSGVIVSAQIVDAGNDSGQLKPQMEEAQDALSNVSPSTLIRTVTADSAYHDTDQLHTMEQGGIVCYVPDDRNKNRKAPGVAEEYHAKAFAYDEATHTMRCPQGQTLHRRKLNPRETAEIFEAPAKACAQCPAKPQCCPTSKSGRNVSRTLDHYQQTLNKVAQRLETPDGKQKLTERWITCEGIFARMLERLQGKRNRMWGKLGAQAELLWRQTTHNLLVLTGIWEPMTAGNAAR